MSTDQPKKPKSVKLISVAITNYKNISKLSEEINGNHFIIFGKNGEGKTTFLQAINRSALRIDPKDLAEVPIKIGAKNAEVGVIFQIDEDGKETKIYVETIFRPSGQVTKVIDLYNKGELKPTIEKLQEYIGESHNVSVLMDLSAEKQFEELLKMLGGKLSLDAYEAEYDEKYNRRKNLNKKIKDQQAYINQITPSVGYLQEHRTLGAYTEKKPIPPPDFKDTDIVFARKDAENKNRRIEEGERRRDEILERIEQLKKQLASEEERLATANQWLEENKKVDLTTFDEQLTQEQKRKELYREDVKKIEKYNEIVDQITKYNQEKQILETTTVERDDVQKQLDDVVKKMKDAIASLKLETIVPELCIVNTLDESGYKPVWRSGVYYRLPEGGIVPFHKKQLSYGKMIVALAKLSAYINSGKFNLMQIEAWNELDEASKNEILRFAEENEDLNIQYGIESVEEKPLGIKIIEKKAK